MTKNGVTFRWIAGLLATLLTLTGGWFVATQVQAGIRRAERVMANSVAVSTLREQCVNLCQQVAEQQRRQETWNERIEEKVDRLLERP